MTTVNWYYLRNPFDNATKGSFKKMDVLATDHHDKLKSRINDPQINTLYTFLKPFYDNFKDVYSKAAVNRGMYKGYTQRVEELFLELRQKKLREWNVRVQIEYLEGTMEYNQIFPNGKTIFQIGGYEARMAAVKTLLNTLEHFPALQNVKQDVEDYYNTLLNAREEQQGRETLEQELSDILEEKRRELAQALWNVFGGLIQLHYNEPYKIENYYELQFLKTMRVEEEGAIEMKTESVSPNSSTIMFKEELDKNTNLVIENDSPEILYAYTTEDISANAPDDIYQVGPNESVNVFADEIMNETGCSTLVLINKSNKHIAVKVGYVKVKT